MARLTSSLTTGLTSVRLTTVTLTAALAAGILMVQAPLTARGQIARPADDQAAAPLLTTYCVSCHNERLKTAGLVIDPATAGNAARNPELWEKVARKLRTRAMPPAGRPHPDDRAYDAAAASLEQALDRAAVDHPRLGGVPAVHRLSRTEYQNAIRDLLALDALPREVSVEFLLPADNISSGFDNIADLLFVSPSTLERYLDAAQKISRIAVGDPEMPPLVNIYRLDEEQPQDERVAGLPYGTRGGTAVRMDVPVDGSYTIKVDLAGAPREPAQIEWLIDGAIVHTDRVGDAAGGPRRGGAPSLEVTLPIAAGTRLIGVTFVQHSDARDEATLRPRMRSRGTQPAMAAVTISGPHQVTAPGDSASRRRIFVCRPASAADETPCARRILSMLAHRAYRRPLVPGDLEDLMPFYAAGRAEGTFDRGIQRALERLLVSSHFLFRTERPPSGTAPGAVYRLDDLALASRLSFFLWSSIPDDELLNVAEAGRLHDTGVLEAQVRRMLADVRADSLITNFAAQWLYLRDIDAKRPDEILFPDFDETLRAAFRRETELFLGSVFRENRGVIELLTADYTFVNERLARHYGIPGIKGSDFRRVTLPAGSVRGGLLGHGSILTNTSYATRTSPVLRGKWVLENLLSSAPPPPPPNIPALKTEGPEPGRTLTMREAMETHRASPACATCHARMDPIGFAMENLDAVGKWRDADGESAIDASGVFPDGTRFAGVAGLKRELVRHQDELVRTVAEKLLMYAIGRNLRYYDAPSVRAIIQDASTSNHTLSALVAAVVKSRPFQMREAAAE